MTPARDDEDLESMVSVVNSRYTMQQNQQQDTLLSATDLEIPNETSGFAQKGMRPFPGMQNNPNQQLDPAAGPDNDFEVLDHEEADEMTMEDIRG